MKAAVTGDVCATRRDLILAVLRYEALLHELDSQGALITQCLQEKCRADTQRAVAKELGISAQYLNDIVRSRRPLAREFVTRMLQGLKRPMKSAAETGD